jgi:SAM-dependent methyltransferase
MSVLGTQASLNNATWSGESARRDLDSLKGFTDPGEQAAYLYVAGDARDKPILDLGVGTGRTVPFFLSLASEYTAVDRLPEMVSVCRSRHPTARVLLGDARTLDDLETGTFQLVNFSYNGIDAVSHDGRAQILRAVRRVLAPGGQFMFSTLNRDGPSFRERPWRLRVWPTRNPIKYLWRAGKQVASAPFDLVRWLKVSGSVEVRDGYALAPLSAHHYGVVAHYTTLARQIDELASSGFDRDVVVYDCVTGARLQPGDDTSQFDWFHIVARAV